MELALNGNQIVSWENGFRLLGVFIALFVIWRSNKHEIASDTLFGQISLMFLFGIVGLLSVASPSNSLYVLVLPVIWSLILVFTLRRLDYDYWAVLDNSVFGLSMLLIVNWVSKLFARFELIDCIGPFGVSVFVVLLYPWMRKNYRVLSWYPSGKTGFIFLAFSCYAIILTLLIAFFRGDTLYLLLLTVLLLALVLGFWYYRSGRNLRSELRFTVNRFKLLLHLKH